MDQTRSDLISGDSFSDSAEEDRYAPPNGEASVTKPRRPVAPIDNEELELERLVLGDQAGFRERLFRDEVSDDDDRSRQEKLGLGQPTKETGLELLDDADVFFLDSLPTDSDRQLARVQATTAGKDGSQVAPAWEDSDDERIAVSLATVSRLRKLRVREGEDIIDGAEYRRRLRQDFLRLQPMPTWAIQSSDRPTKRRRLSSTSNTSSESEDPDDNSPGLSALPLAKILRDIRHLSGTATRKGRPLRPEVIDIQRTRDIPDVHKAAVASMCFHPEFPVLLSASTSSVLFLHRIDASAHPTPHPALTSIQARQIPVQRAEFLYPNGNKIFFAGRRRFFHTWDVSSGLVQKISNIQGHHREHRSMERFRLSPCGRYMGLIATTRKGGGVINILSTSTMQWIAAARLDSRGGIIDFNWWRGGGGLTILGKGGQIGEWSMEKRSFVGIWNDDGSIGGTAIALGGQNGPEALGGDAWIAVGSSSGVMNVYNRHEIIERETGSEVWLKERPSPTRVFEQLQTPVTTIIFSPDGQLLVFASVHKKDALRLAHLPSCTVYRNWPTEQTPLGRVTAIQFGRQSDSLAVGNDAGKIRLWEIRN